MVGAHIDKFDVEQVQKSFDALIELTKIAPFSSVIYEFYDYQAVTAVPVEATAFCQRDKVCQIEPEYLLTSPQCRVPVYYCPMHCHVDR